jgi:lipoprotein-anchoring transpeptidase ErfK/SrfK
MDPMTCRRIALQTAVFTATAFWSVAAAANPLADLYLRGPAMSPPALHPLSVEETIVGPDLRRQLVVYPAQFTAGTVVIDTDQTYLYYVLGGGKAIRYGIGVGRDGFTWAGTEAVTRKAEWPDWAPPAEMIARQPYLSRWMAGGEGNPLGARAIYLGNTVYRIHGTNMPDTIGQKVSSGCIRMLNVDVIDLYQRVSVGTKIVVLPSSAHVAAENPVLAARLPRQLVPGVY